MRTIRLVNHNTGTVIEQQCANNLVAHEFLADSFHRSPYEDGVYYKEREEAGVYDRYDMEE